VNIHLLLHQVVTLRTVCGKKKINKNKIK
jgi:hypothetical protein